jgi:glutamate N-acetyltransferase/amino-acid N-acetyltransferase
VSVSAPAGFRAMGVSCGIKPGKLDLALVHNLGPNFDFAAVFTTNEVKAAPVLWSEQIAKTDKARAILLNSGGANACTGPAGFSVTHNSAEYLAEKLGLAPIDVAVCSTGIIGEQLDLIKIKTGIDALTSSFDNDGGLAAQAILTTDSKRKEVLVNGNGYSIGGMAKGAGMLAPSLATMLVVITTDADLSKVNLSVLLRVVANKTFNRISSDGCTSTNDSIMLMANGSSKVSPTSDEFEKLLTEVCSSLANQLILDAEGATVFVELIVDKAKSENQAELVAKKVASDSLVKTALFGRDPNWGRVAAAAGSAGAGIDPNSLDVYFNEIPLCLNGAANGDRHRVKLNSETIRIRVSLNQGSAEVKFLTTDLSTKYVLENSEYSS